MAEREGFEPSVGCPTLAFRASTIDHSVISPYLDTKNPPLIADSNFFNKKNLLNFAHCS